MLRGVEWVVFAAISDPFETILPRVNREVGR
jgi:hypothetical protein